MHRIPHLLEGTDTQPSNLYKFHHNFLGGLQSQLIFFFHGTSLAERRRKSTTSTCYPSLVTQQEILTPRGRRRPIHFSTGGCAKKNLLKALPTLQSLWEWLNRSNAPDPRDICPAGRAFPIFQSISDHAKSDTFNNRLPGKNGPHSPLFSDTDSPLSLS